MEWSPENALDAYLHTLHLLSKIEEDNAGGGKGVIEPKCIELISAMAAGKGAKSIVEITTQGVTPLTLALGVAATQNGGQLTCINVNRLRHRSRSNVDSEEPKDSLAFQHKAVDHVRHAMKLVQANGCPGDVIMDLNLKNIDFAVIDCKFDDQLELFRKLNVNPNASTVIVHNLNRTKPGVSFAQAVKRRIERVESATLPIGEGIELTTIGLRSSSMISPYRMKHVIRRTHEIPCNF